MQVKDLMTRNPMTVEVDTPLATADHLMKENKISGLPVLRDGELVGFLTSHDVQAALASTAAELCRCEYLDLLKRARVGDLMIETPVTIGDEDTVAHAAELMLKDGISRLPVIAGNSSLVGIVTDSDILKSCLRFASAKRSKRARP